MGGAWGFEVDDVQQRVHLWYGEHDQMATVNNGHWLSDHLPDGTLTVYPEEGHLVPMRHWQQILKALN